MDRETFERHWINVQKRIAMRNKYYPMESYRTQARIREVHVEHGKENKGKKRVRFIRRYQKKRDKQKSWSAREARESLILQE